MKKGGEWRGLILNNYNAHVLENDTDGPVVRTDHPETYQREEQGILSPPAKNNQLAPSSR